MCFHNYLLSRFLMVLVVLQLSCSTTPINTNEDNEEDQARQALELGDYDAAIEKIGALIAKYPLEYKYYPLIATAYASRSGVDLVAIVKTELFSSGGDGAVDITAIDKYIPTTPNDTNISDIDTAVDWIKQMPLDHRSDTSDYEYGPSASLQLSLYATTAFNMKTNQLKSTTTGDVDPEKLEDLSDAEVDSLIDSLQDAVDNGENSAVSAEVAAQAAEALDEIAAQPGATQKEKIQNYINSQETGN